MKSILKLSHFLFTALLCFLAINFVNAQTWNTNSSAEMYLNPTSSRVGIGTTNPSNSYKLHVSGSSSSNGIYSYVYGSGRRAIYGRNTHSSGYAGYFYGKLFVNGDIEAAINKRIKVGSSGGSMLSLHAATCCPGAYIDYDNGPLVFRVQGSNSQSPLTLQSNGTVVINPNAVYNGNVINTNGHELSVNGGIWCEEVEVTANVPASDYVFYDDYKLMSLADVERFVKQNHHLPEVPSAADFKKNGYKLGDMDDLLLRKVEELTLYTIDANKKIEKLNTENQALTSQNQQLLDRLAQMEARLTALEEGE